MKKCKYCQSDIDYKAKICPVCKKKTSSSALAIIIIIIAVLVIIGYAASDKEGSRSSSSSNSTVNDISNTIKDATNSNKKFDVNITSQYNDSFAYYIEGTAKNITNKNYSYLQIEFICYDSEGNNIGTALDNTNNLLGNQTWKFKAMFLGTENVNHCDFHEITGW